MKIAFGDLIACDYTIDTPYQQPLGGSQSALCYLAAQLARDGHEVFLLNNTTTPGIYRGVNCLSVPLTNLDRAKRLELDAFVVLNLTGYGANIRSLIGQDTQLILWTGHTHHNRDMQALHNPEERDIYDGFAFVSAWQRDCFCAEFGIARDRTAVLKNAIAPAFTGLFTNSDILPQKTQPPVLAYTSTPFRGLDLLLEIFPTIRQAIPGTRLKVFSSMKLYHVNDAADQENYGHLYRQCRETEGVQYIGAISQTELAPELQKVTVLAYPNTYLETSCIAVMEAMASGCHVVTSNLGALPETTAGFARLISMNRDRATYKYEFTQAVIQVLSQFDELPLRQMVDYINRGFTWSVRSGEWVEWLAFLKHNSSQLGYLGSRQELKFQKAKALTTNVNPLKLDRTMKIGFIDFSDWDYQVASPYQRPLGGSQSALCYLAEALAKLGHDIWLFNGTSQASKSRQVNCLPLPQVFAPNSPYQDMVNSLDVVIILNQAGKGRQLRQLLANKTRLVLWTQQVPTLDVMQPLRDKNEQLAYDGIAFVSSWQRDRFLAAFGIAPEKTKILRNAIAPAFAQQFSAEEDIISHKLKPPVLAYTSTPFRGLDLLLNIFPQIRQAYPGTRLKVFSSKKVYQLPQSVDESEYGGLYRQCREMDGVDYMGSISQPELAQELRSVSVLAYANTFAETSCIAVMEAMASGCQVVTSDLAALPETTTGYGRLVSVADVQGFSDVRDWRFSQRQDWKAYGDRFVRATLEVLRNYYSQEIHLRQMVDYINHACTWDVRSHEWANWLQELLAADRVRSQRFSVSNQVRSQRFSVSHPTTDESLQINLQLHGQAEKLFYERKLTESLAMCQQSIRMQPNFAPGYKLLGNILQSQGNIQAAMRAYETAIALNPNFAEAHANLGSMYYQLGNCQSAIDCYQTAINLQPDLAGAYWNLAKVFETQRQPETATAYRQKALKLQPSLQNLAME